MVKDRPIRIKLKKAALIFTAMIAVGVLLSLGGTRKGFCIDIGFKMNSGKGIVTFEAEPAGTLTSPLRIKKAGTTYGIVLVATNDANASSARIKTSTGTKALKLFRPIITVGQSYGGGIVVYILQPGDLGYVTGETHGLIAATSNQGAAIAWWNGSYLTTNATGVAVGTGQTNTTKIVNTQGAGSYAASVCNDYIVTVEGVTYDDWFLPSKDELNLLYAQNSVVGGFANAPYWSSTEYSNVNAWFQVFPNGFQGGTGKNDTTVWVRAVRAFSAILYGYASLTTNAVSNITTTTASSGGNISNDGGAAVTARGVCWSTSQNPTITTGSITSNSSGGTGIFTSNLTSLTGGTTYYVRAYATNSAGTAYGDQVSFTTSPVIASLTTTAGSNITAITAISGGNISNDGGAAVTARGVCWSTSVNPTTANSKTTDGSGTGSFTSSLTSLTASTIYYVRAYATNSAGTAYGDQVSFTTNRIGESYGGGIIFYVDGSGLHGLIAAIADQSSGAFTPWSNITNTSIGTTGTAVGSGEANTTAIINQGATSGAAVMCRAYNGGGFTDWFLPSRDELNLLYAQKSVVGGFANNWYWSSTENNWYLAWLQLFDGGGNQSNGGDKSSGHFVRAVRAFSAPYGYAILTTTAVSNITATTASSGGNISNDGGAAVTARGVCWSTYDSPTIADSKTSDGSGTGSFVSSLTGLWVGTTYYVRAYATNSAGTAYGDQVSFTTAAAPPSPFAIGQSYGGGIIFYVDGSGLHGLIAAIADQSTGAVWSNITNTLIGTTGTAVGSGYANTTAIINQSGHTGSAAALCRAYNGGGFSDWFLPSRDELTLLYARLDVVPGFACSPYWSSSEYNISSAWYRSFCYGSQGGTGKNDATVRVRAVRAFSATPGYAILTTTAVSNITATTASSGGNISNDGGTAVTARGVCWSTSANPTTADSKTSDGSGTGSFVSSLTSLTASTTYYVRAYATNSSGTAYNDQVSFTTTPPSFDIGQTYGGGLVGYIFQPGDPGYVTGETHGLICAASDQSAFLQWYNGEYKVTGATATALGTGKANTTTIVSVQGAGSYAAQLCHDMILNGYNDWYLPSKDELNLMWSNLKLARGLGNFTYSYWCSSAIDDPNDMHPQMVWCLNTYQDYGWYHADKSASGGVRAIRDF